VLRHVRQQGDIAVRERRNDELRFSRVRPSTASGHGVRPVPDAIELVAFGGAETGDLELVDERVEHLPVQLVERRPRQLAGPHAIHRGLVAGAPGVGELGPVDVQVFRAAERRALRDDRAAVIDGVPKTSNVSA